VGLSVKDRKKEKTKAEKKSVGLPLRSWETSKMKSPLCFPCMDLTPAQTSIIKAKELFKALFKCFAKSRKLIVIFLTREG
jgi:hypothetical protein